MTQDQLLERITTNPEHDVVWIGDWAQDLGDRQILKLAQQESRVLVTLEEDFGELAIVLGEPHSGIIRLVGLSAGRPQVHAG